MLLDVDLNGSGAATFESFYRAGQEINGSIVRDETYRFALFADHRGFRLGDMPDAVDDEGISKLTEMP